MQPLPTYAVYASTYGFAYTDAYYYLSGYLFPKLLRCSHPERLGVEWAPQVSPLRAGLQQRLAVHGLVHCLHLRADPC